VATRIVVYGVPHNGQCIAITDKLKRIGLEFESRNLREYLDPNSDVPEEDRARVTAAWEAWSHRIPLLSVDGTFYDYPSGFRVIRELFGPG